jgi:DNA-binding NarL/FixJ family response regulator
MASNNKATRRKARLLIVDDHPIARMGLAQLINQTPDLVVCGEAESAAQARQLIESLKPDLALVDVALKGESGIELVKSAKQQFPGLKALMLSMHEESQFAERALRAGACGYIMKESEPEKILGAIRNILAGHFGFSEAMTHHLLARLADGTFSPGVSLVNQLSDRELEIFRFIGRGLGTREIAAKINLSPKTVETHRVHIRHKLKCKDAQDLARVAYDWVREGH